jgi:hypothetical protein
MANTQDFVITQGKTFSQVLRWEAPPILYKPITLISKVAPVLINAASHGIPSGWRVAVVSVLGMTEINAKNTPPRNTDYHQATVVDPNTIALNDVNASGYTAYSSGGYLQLNTPVDLTGFIARMTIKDRIAAPSLLTCTTGGTTGLTLPTAAGSDGTAVWSAAPAGSSRSITWTPSTVVTVGQVIDTHELLRLDTTTARIAIDTVNYTITLTIDAATTAAISWTTGVYDLEMVSATNVVTGLLSGNISISQEVTT